MYSLQCSADFHQASEHLPIEARGRQCVPTGLVFLIAINYVKPCDTFQTEDLNDVLFAGSYLYSAVCQNHSLSGFIDPSTLPQRISYKGHTVYTTHKGLITGLMDYCMPEDCAEIFYNLENAFYKATSMVQNVIIIFNEISVAIHIKKSNFYIFDSHSRSQSGMCCPDGNCVLGLVHSVSELCNFLRQLLDSTHNHATRVQFDLHMLTFRKKYMRTPYGVKILEDRPGFEIQQVKKRKHSDADCETFRQGKMRGLKNGKTVAVISSRHMILNEQSLSCDQRSVEQSYISHNSGQVDMSEQSGSCSQIFLKEQSSLHENDIVTSFHALVSSGPDYVCSCCTQTFFSHNVKKIETLSGSKKTLIAPYCTQYKSVGNFEWICQTCWDAARQGKTPKFWLQNGLKFPCRPRELELSNLEERLVSPRIPFMQFREMPRGGQVSLKGNIVNVPADVNETIKSLPRMIDENETIMLKFKRRLSYKHHVAFENIRPNKVFQAAKWLVANSLLFRNEGIVVNDTWLQEQQGVIESLKTVSEAECEENDEYRESDDNWTEHDSFSERPTGNLDTFLQSADFREFNQVMSVAPGEKNSPIGIFQDFHAEFFSFPTIYCGQPRVENQRRVVPLHYSDICKWELRNVDRRVALCVPNIFFKLKRLQIKQIKDKVLLAVRKCKSKNQSYTAGEILTPGFVEKLTMQDDGYRVLRTLRGSPPYWEAAKQDVFAMIRQLGIPTWFCSFSAAETKWAPLLVSLSKLVQNRHLSLHDINDLSWQDKCHLIKSDPVTCARYFHNRVQIFMKHVLKHPCNPIGEIIEYFYRVEFQQRGSPHIHMIVWTKDAPVHGVASDIEISTFVNKYVSCFKDDTMPTLINYQTHRHARTCRKQGKASCRFSFPIPPLPETLVLHPVSDTESVQFYSEKYEHIVSCLNDLKEEESDISFDSFLSVLEMDYDTYILAVRSSLSRPKVFLKRSVNEVRINNYSRVLLRSWEANMDIQYILDPYSCVSYVVSYISKGQRGLSNLLQAACAEAKEIDSDIRQRVRRIGNQFLSSVEIGAQEAVFLVLQIPLRKCTRDVIYVDTNKAEQRTSLLKSMSDLKDLPANSKNTDMDNTLKRYKRRPKSLETICYADFASWYDLFTGKSKNRCTNTGMEELPETNYLADEDDNIEKETDVESHGNVVEFACGTLMRKRQVQKVIYSHCTPITHDRQEHFREKLMLYTHWRNEDTDIIAGFQTYEECYNAMADEVKANEQKYERLQDSLSEEVLPEIDSDNITGIVNPEADHQNLIDVEEGTSTAAELGCFDPGSAEGIEEDYDLGEDLDISRKRVVCESLPMRELDTEQYLQSVRILNAEQKRFFYHILHKIKTGSLPFHIFLSGGAGCGKSVLIGAIYQAVLKYFNHQYGENPASLKLLLCAPTGKAAHNIGGSTVHSAFCIPASQGFHFKPLDMQQLNTMRAHYHELKVVIIDEISMVGRGMFNFINLRLQEIKGCTRPFGGVSILAVGDLYQLKPVHDSWVFSQIYRRPDLECIAANLWVELFEFFELTKVMRQKDDLAFVDLLNRLREGKHTAADLAVLESRKVEKLTATPQEIKHLPHLFCTRADVNAHNMDILSVVSPSEKINIEAVDSVSGNICQSVGRTILSRLPLDPSKTMGLQKNLVLGIGLPVELCVNLDTRDGLTNGASSVIRKFDFRVENSSRCSIVWVEFDSDCVGKTWRLKYKHLYNSTIASSWTPILETSRKFIYKYHKTYLIVRRQFPLYLSSGKTIHKAQGSTIQGAVIHFGNRKIDHIHYVGLSRVTSISGVHIKELNSAKISVSLEVETEMYRLRSTRQLNDIIPVLSRCDTHVMKVSFQNCRSLRKHILDLGQEHNLLQSDILGLAETRLSGLLPETCDIAGFKHWSSTFEQASHGIAVYYRESVSVGQFICFSSSGIECALVGLTNGIVVGFLYCPPKYSSLSHFAEFVSVISRTISRDFGMINFANKLILMGDFNYDFNENKAIAELLQVNLECKQLINTVTTDYNSCLDHIYCNLSVDRLRNYGTLESYYSDHKPVYLEYAV